jgi:predicted MarR family transcription regulator
MKPTSTPNLEQDAADELRPEYSFDYRTARPNRFAGLVDKGQVVVMLDADISEVFTTSESVNAVLRALIETMPTTQTKSASGVAVESVHQLNQQ